MMAVGPGPRRASAALEIERKFLLDGRPDIPESAEVWKIRQGYLSPGAPGSNRGCSADDFGRIRCVELADGSQQCTHTIKTGTGLVRSEIERPISRSEFDRLWPRTQGRRLNKTRYRVREGGLVWEIDVFDDLELVLAEVELPTEDAPAPVPAWLAPHLRREVTDDQQFTNAQIALQVAKGR